MMNVELLDFLLRAEGALTVRMLSGVMGMDAMAVASEVEGLKRADCEIESHPQQGVWLHRAGLGCYVDYLEGRHEGRIGHRVLVYRETTSTQAVARGLIEGATDNEQFHGWVVMADHQTAGRGRLGRSWVERAGGGLLMTVIVGSGVCGVDRLMLASCHGVAEAVNRLCGIEVQVRWPNDLMVDGRKLGGILVERIDGVALIGIGMNVSPMPREMEDEVGYSTASLAGCGCMADRLLLADNLLNQLDEALFETSDKVMIAAWRERSSLLQQRVTVLSDGRKLVGRVIDIDPEQGLLLQVEHGPVVKLHAATTSLVVD